MRFDEALECVRRVSAKLRRTEKTMTTHEPAFKVRVKRDGCTRCGEGKQWEVYGLFDVSDLTDRVGAERLASVLNVAYEHGRRHRSPTHTSVIYSEPNLTYAQEQSIRERFSQLADTFIDAVKRGLPAKYEMRRDELLVERGRHQDVDSYTTGEMLYVFVTIQTHFRSEVGSPVSEPTSIPYAPGGRASAGDRI